MATSSGRKAALKAMQKVQNWALASEAAPRINAMLDLGRSEEGIPILPEQMNGDPWLFNCDNGTLELRTGRLREHRRTDYMTKLCPTRYVPGATCPTWERFLGAVFPTDEDEPDAELISYVQRFLGRCLTGDVSEQTLEIWWGGGANGKSTLINAVFGAVGKDYAMKAAPELLMASHGDRHPTERADLFGMRLVVASETQQGRRLNEAFVKDITGGEPIRARRMREDFWEFPPSHKTVLITNHKPRVAGTDEGIWRRIRLVPFVSTFWDPSDPGKDPCQLPENRRQDKQLGAKLAAEAEGILAWMVRGCLDWQREGMPVPEKVRAATSDYRREQDLLAQWIEEKCLTGNTTLRAKASELYGSYRAWCERAGEEEIMNQTGFGTALTERGYERHKTGGTIWRLGIALSDGDSGDS
jgi:putative DNA primase/helicase